MKLVEPRVYLLGWPHVNMEGLLEYLKDSGQQEFLALWNEVEGMSDGEKLCSFYAKLCYKSLVVGKNDNISKIRDIESNFKSIINTAHGSCLEHCNLNFIVTNCSRILTHETVRHRAGWAYSQTSGRYCRGDEIDFVFDPILDQVKNEVVQLLNHIETEYNSMVERMGLNEAGLEMGWKKKVTSALRRILPGGQANEIGITVNVRALRHFIMMRTSRIAEWEIRKIGEQIYYLIKAKFPLMVFDAFEEEVDGIVEVSGMKMQPYEKG